MKKWKWVALGLAVLMMVTMLIGTSVATVGRKAATLDYKDIKVTLNGEQINLVNANGEAVEPFIIDGTTYLPVRAVAEALGLEVDWEGSTATVILTTPEDQKPTYITRTGQRWHNDPHCNGGTYWEVPHATAVGMGLTPCDKCVHD